MANKETSQQADGVLKGKEAASDAGLVDEAAVGDSSPDSTSDPKETSADTLTIAGRNVKKGDLVKFVSLIAAIILISAIFVALWPLVKDAYSEGGIDGLVEQVRASGPIGVVTLLVLQFLQVLVAFIPGEVVQFAAGALYGPIGGTIVILVGCALSTAAVYKLVHELGAPFVQSMVSDKFLDKFGEFEHSGKLSVLVFILYLIPGLPKDTFSYLVPLTNMKMGVFVALTTVARIPGVFASCFVASGLVEGSYVAAAVMTGCVVLIVVLCIIFRKPLMDLLKRLS